jgi:hypothetical protein
MAAKRTRRPREDTTTLGKAGLDQLVDEMGRRLNSSQEDQFAFLRQIKIPGPVGLQLRKAQQQMAQGLEGWTTSQRSLASQPSKKSGNKYPETTRRTRAYGPDGRPAVLDRPIDHRRITDTNRKDMLLCPPIALGMAARIGPVVGSFSSWAPTCEDPIQRALIKTVLEGIIHRLVADSLHGSLAYGFAPFELVWDNNVDVELNILEGDDEDLVFDTPSSREFAKTDPAADTTASSATASPVVVAPPKRTNKTVVFPGATILRKAKDLNPTKTEILVEGSLNSFAGLRYDSDSKQELDPVQSFVVTHNGRFGQMYGNSALDAVYAPWYVIEIVTQLCNMYLDRKGDPPYKGFAPLVGSYDADGNVIHGYQVMVDGINLLKSGGGFVMPSDYDDKGNRKYDLEAMSEDPRVEIFVRWIEHMIRMILWGLLIPDGSVWQNSRVGSFAASQTFADVAINLREIDLRGIESYINSYLVERVLQMNFATPKRASIQAKTRPDVKVAMLNKTLLKVLDVKTVPGQVISNMIDWQDLLKQAGFPTI